MGTAEESHHRLPGHRNIILLGLVSFFNDTSSEMIYWILPQFLVASLGASPTYLGLIEGVAESVASFSKLASGYLADRLRRRKPLVVAGYLLANFVKPFLALAEKWSHVLAIRFADRLGKGVRTAPRDVMIVESAAANAVGSAFGLRQTMDSAGAIAGPLLALGLLPLVGGDLRTIFWLAAVPGAISVLLVSFAVRETRVAGSRAKVPDEVGTPAGPSELSANRARWGGRFYLLLGAVGLFGLANSSDLFLVLRAQNLGVRPGLAPALGLVFNAVYTAGAWPAGKLSDRVARKHVIASGFLLFSASYLGFAVSRRADWVWGLFAVYGLYYALSEGVLRALVADLVGPGQRGAAYGWLALVTSAALLPASLLAGWLWVHFSPATPFYFSAMVSFLAALLIWFL